MALSDFPRVIAALARGALRSIAGQLRRGLGGLGLINWIRRTFAPLTTTEASLLRQATDDYLSAGIQQNALPPGASLNPANVPSVTAGGMPSGSTGSVQFDVRIHWEDQVTGRDHWATVFVDSGSLLTNQDLLNQIDQAFSDMTGRYIYEKGGGTPPAPSLVGFSVYGVVQK